MPPMNESGAEAPQARVAVLKTGFRKTELPGYTSSQTSRTKGHRDTADQHHSRGQKAPSQHADNLHNYLPTQSCSMALPHLESCPLAAAGPATPHQSLVSARLPSEREEL